MTDLELAKLGRREQLLAGKVSGITTERNKIRAIIANEMEQRGTDAIEIQGVRIKYVRPESVEYDIEAIKKKRPLLWKFCQSEFFDVKKLAEAVAKKKVSPETLATFSIVKARTPYPQVTIGK